MPTADIVSSLTTMLVVVDPVGLAPVFLVLTFGMSDAEKRRVAVQASFVTFVLLVAAALGGEWLLRQLGIGIPAFRIAGGLLLFMIAFEMVLGERTDRKLKKGRVEEARDEGGDVAIFPLAIPLMAGPGAMTAAVLLAGNTEGAFLSLAALILVIGIVAIFSALVFIFASRFERVIDRTWQIVFARILGLILAALAVQIVIDGLAGVGVLG